MQDDHDHSGGEKDGDMGFDRRTLHAAIEDAVSGHSEIAAAYLFGSAARGTATPLSDVDVGLLFRGSDAAFRERLSIAVGIGSAIARDLSGAPVDARDLDQLPLAIVGAVLTDGELVVSNDEERRVAFERDTRLRYFDFLPIHLREVREANAALRGRFLRG